MRLLMVILAPAQNLLFLENRGSQSKTKATRDTTLIQKDLNDHNISLSTKHLATGKQKQHNHKQPLMTQRFPKLAYGVDESDQRPKEGVQLC